MISKKHQNQLISLIYLSFAFDSLLKINVGIKLHVGIILILLLNIYNIITKKTFHWSIPKQDIWGGFFTIFIFISGIIFSGLSGFALFFYFFLAINVYAFVIRNFQKLDYKTFLNFQKILIVTGLFQIVLFYLFDYQINFLDEIDHYSKGGSVTFRVRGFFVEPNWFAIAITFNSFILVKNDIVHFLKKNKWLSFFTFLVMVLNGSVGTLAIFVVIYTFKYLKKNIIIGLFIVLTGLLAGLWIMSERAQIKKEKDGIAIFNYYSRTEPLLRVSDFLYKQPVLTKIFGEGFGTWGTIAVRNRLSVLVYRENSMSRDGSELPVFWFELGYFGLFLFFLDWLNLFINNYKKNIYIKGALILFLACFILYPIFKFLMYMIYYFFIRAMIYKNRTISALPDQK